MSRSPCGCVDKVSASALDTAESCLRKWAFRAIDKVDAPSHPSAVRGTKIHAVMESYYETGGLVHGAGHDPEHVQIWTHAVRHLPDPIVSPWISCEQHFVFGEFHGYKDLTDRWGLYDLKTTGNLNYAKTSEDLLQDFQFAIYSAHEMAIRKVAQLDTRWLYLKATKPYRAHPVDTLVTRGDIAETLNRARTLAGQLIQIKKKPEVKANDLEPNFGACLRYGGCPYLSRCERPIEGITEMTMSQIDRIAQMINPGAVSAPSTSEVSDIATTEAEVESRLSSISGAAPEGFFWIWPVGSKIWTIIHEAQPLPPAPTGSKWRTILRDGFRAARILVVDVPSVAPIAVPPVAVPVAVAPPVAVPPVAVPVAVAPPVAVPPVAAPVAVAPPVAEDAPAAPRRGRPPGAKNRPKPTTDDLGGGGIDMLIDGLHTAVDGLDLILRGSR